MIFSPSHIEVVENLPTVQQQQGPRGEEYPLQNNISYSSIPANIGPDKIRRNPAPDGSLYTEIAKTPKNKEETPHIYEAIHEVNNTSEKSCVSMFHRHVLKYGDGGLYSLMVLN